MIAEGVETAEQLAYLREQQCDQIQGYYFSRPLPANRMEQLLKEHSANQLSAVTAYTDAANSRLV